MAEQSNDAEAASAPPAAAGGTDHAPEGQHSAPGQSADRHESALRREVEHLAHDLDKGEEALHEEEERLLDVLRRRLIKLETMPRSLWLATGLTFAQIVAAGLLIAVHAVPQPVLTTDWQGGYAVHMPVIAFGAAFVLLVIAWTFLLTGALYTHWSMRFAILAVFTLFVTDQGLLLAPTTFANTPILSLAVLAVVLGLWGWSITALLRARRSARHGNTPPQPHTGIPLRAFIVILFSLLGVYGIAFWSFRTATVPYLFQNTIALQVESVAFLLIPVLFLAGTDFAEWGELMASRVAHVAARARLRGGRRSLWPLAIVCTLLPATIIVQVLISAQVGLNVGAALAVLAPPLALGVGFVLALLLVVRVGRVGGWSPGPVPVAALVAAAIVLQGGGMLVTAALSAAFAPSAAPVVQDFAVYRHDTQQPAFSLAYPAQWAPKVVADDASQRVTGVVFDGSATDNRATFSVFSYPAATEPRSPDQVLDVLVCKGCSPTISAQPDSGAWQVLLFRAGSFEGEAWTRESAGQVWLLYGMSPPDTFAATLPVDQQIVESWRPDQSAVVPAAPPGTTTPQRAVQISNDLIGVTNGLVPLLLGLGIGLPLLLRGRRRGGRGAMAGLYFAVVGLLDAVLFLPSFLVVMGLPLQHIHFSLPAFQLLVAVATLGVVAWLAAHRPWTERGTDLLTMLFVLNGGLLFISWMFAYFDRTQSVDPRFTVIQAVLLVVAEGWDLLMSGEQVTNVEGPESPRHSRVLMYLGYVTLVCTAILYFTAETTASPDPPAGAFFASDAWPQEGVFLLGAPVLITGFLLELCRWWTKRGAHDAAGTSAAATGAGASEASASTEVPTAPAPTASAAVDVRPAPRPQEPDKRGAMPSA